MNVALEIFLAAFTAPWPDDEAELIDDDTEIWP